MWCVRTFYRFTPIEDPLHLQQSLKDTCDSLHLCGIILVASEGINSTLAGSQAHMDAFWDVLTQDIRFQGMTYKESFTDKQPFKRIRVRLKKEIVTLGVPEIDPTQRTGSYVAPEAWNDLIQDPDVVVIDVRNAYEISIGSFQGARDPKTATFRDFPAFVKTELEAHRASKIAMFCTGGIRCEKASSYMMSEGFQHVFQLSGGILQYIENVSPEASLWQGECFVFDRRVAMNHDLHAGQHTVCYGCRMPLSPEDCLSPAFRKGVHCHHCKDVRTPQQHRKAEERLRQSLQLNLS